MLSQLSTRCTCRVSYWSRFDASGIYLFFFYLFLAQPLQPSCRPVPGLAWITPL